MNLTILRQGDRPYIMNRTATDTRRPCRESGLVHWQGSDVVVEVAGRDRLRYAVDGMEN